MQGKATTKSNQIDFYYIERPDDFTLCMDAVAAIGFSGTLTSTVGPDGLPIWQLVLNGAVQTGVTLIIGQVISWDGKQLTHWDSADAFLALNTIP
jgi:hypothetical protein